jgi:hypothetical protein
MVLHGETDSADEIDVEVLEETGRCNYYFNPPCSTWSGVSSEQRQKIARNASFGMSWQPLSRM